MDLQQLSGMKIYSNSVAETEEAVFFLAADGSEKRLGIMGDAAGFEGSRQGELSLCLLTAENASALRKRFSWLRPQTLGLRTSAGCGDRLGLATPGHIRALRQVGADIAPILAQQSMRENSRTGRNPQQVMNDAMWGVFQEGWRAPWGADADHLKTKRDVDLCVAAGYTFFTIDPGDHVDNAAHTAPESVLQKKIDKLPWHHLEDSPRALYQRYAGKRFKVEDITVEFDHKVLARAAAKYGRAIAHTVQMYRHLASRCQDFELEMSVDETETPTSVPEHYFIAKELQRLGVRWVSLAPRYIGRFEKGVDYIGDLAEFEAELARHSAIARVLGPYKLSIHSGSDKFSIYPLIARHARGLVHLKTAGTSYLEGLRAVAQVEPDMFRQILACALDRYLEDRATYHVSAELVRIPRLGELKDGDLPAILDQFDARQVLHVTFGSVLERLGAEIISLLATHEQEHYAALEAHFIRHLAPFG